MATMRSFKMNIHLCSVLFVGYAVCHPLVTLSKGNVLTAEEKERVSLSWPMKNTIHAFRYWCKGNWNTRPPTDEECIFKQFLRETPTDMCSRKDMGVNTDFDLTIGKTELGDTGNYTAIVVPESGPRLYTCVTLAVYRTVLAEEESSVTLPWPFENTRHVLRYWYLGHYYGGIPSDTTSVLFKQYLQNTPENFTEREDMMVNTGFDLTIGKTQLGDANTYTALVRQSTGEPVIGYANLIILKTPTLTLTGLDGRGYDEGEPVDVSCILKDGYPEIHLKYLNIDWQGRDFNDNDKDNTTVSGDKYYSYKIEKSLNLTSNDNNVNVTCSVFLTVAGRVIAESKILDVSYPPKDEPKIVIKPTDTNQYEVVTFECITQHIDVKPGVSMVTWTKDDRTLTEWQNMFTFTNIVTGEDRGAYRCHVGNALGSCSSTQTLLNVTEYFLPQGSPMLTINNLTPYTHETVVLTCLHDGIDARPPVSRIRWLKDDMTLHDEAAPSNTRTMTDVTVYETGHYGCRVGNHAGLSAASSSLYLDVSALYRPQNPPPASVNDATPYTRDTVTFACSRQGNDANPAVSELKWTKDGVLAAGTDVYTIQNVNVSQSGNYECAAGNGIGFSDPRSVRLDVDPRYPPYGVAVIMYEPEKPVIEDSVTFTCDTANVEANPYEFDVVWTKDGDELPWTNAKEHAIDTVGERDNGLYKCSISNGIRNAISSNTVELLISPLCVESREVEENEQIMIPYVTSATTPLNRFWYRGHGYDINNPPKADSLLFTFVYGGNEWVKGPAAHDDMAADPVDYSLTISKVHLEDNGYISCKTLDRDTTLDIYDHAIEVLVFKTPKLEMYGIDMIDYKEGDPVYLTCALTDSYPEVDLRLFYIHWEGRTLDNKEDTTAAGDKYYSYRIVERTLLVKEDDQLVVTCSVQLTVGKQLPSVSRTLHVSRDLPADLPTSPETSLSPGAMAAIAISSTAAVYWLIVVLCVVICERW